MKQLIILLLLVFPIALFGQVKLDTSKIKKRYGFKTSPTYFIDSVKMDMSKTYLDPDNIESIKVIKEDREVFITSKNQTHNWVVLSELKVNNPNYDSALPRLFVIDGHIIDTLTVRLELSSIRALDFLNSATNYGNHFMQPTKKRHCYYNKTRI